MITLPIVYKNTKIAKHNQYIWCGVVDKNGRMLKDSLCSLNNELVSVISESSEVSSDIIFDKNMYEIGMHNSFPKKYKKLIHDELHYENLGKYGIERGRFGKERIYLYNNWDDAFYNIETFFNGVLWLFTSIDTLVDDHIIKYIDEIRLLRVNHDFIELYGEDAVTTRAIDDILSASYTHTDTIKSKYSEELVLHASKKRHGAAYDIADNGMLIKRSAEKIKNLKLPELYDFCTQIFTFGIVSVDNQVVKQKVNTTKNKTYIR